MGSPRRQGREVALQILCAVDANPSPEPAGALDLYFSHLAAGAEDEDDMPGVGKDVLDRPFVETLVRAALVNREAIDATITQISRSWRLDRMARVDRNILRLAVAEMLHLPEVPARVSINEAVELAKRFGAAESPAFVNGLLDSAIKSLDLGK
jgi:N utilization substance protein B